MPLKILPLLLLLLVATIPAYASIKAGDPCDSIILSNNKAYAVKNLQTSQQGITFSFCTDTANVVHQAPWGQIHHLKRADGTVILSPVYEVENLSPEQLALREEQRLDRKAKVVLGLAILSVPLFFVGVGGLFAGISLIWGASIWLKIRHQKRMWRIRRKLLWAMVLSGLVFGATVAILAISAASLIKVLFWFFHDTRG